VSELIANGTIYTCICSKS